jgi:hypothetical protein
MTETAAAVPVQAAPAADAPVTAPDLAAEVAADVAPDAKPAPRDGARFAELAKRQRELTQRQLEIKAKEERLNPIEQALSKSKENPLAALEALGMTYEDLTHYILSEGKEPGPEDKLAAIEKRLNDRETAEREAREKEANERVEATLSQFKGSIASAAKADPAAYEMILAMGDYGTELVFDTVSEYFQSNQQVLPLETALQAVESYLEGEALKVAQANKIKARLLPPTAKETDKSPERQSGQQTVTLTNKLVSSASDGTKRLSEEESKRAAAALLRWT